MPRICFVLIAGLDGRLLAATPGLSTLKSFDSVAAMEPVWPAVTCTMQATLTTGVTAAGHGIIANGLYTHGRDDLHAHLDLTSFPEFRREVSFWEQSNRLLTAPRFWHETGQRVAMLFWQNSMEGAGGAGGAADIVVTPKPTHTPDGKTLTACWSNPPELYEELTKKLGPFPLMNYWGPMSNLASSRWIIECTRQIWQRGDTDVVLTYLPHMDYNLQRRGPGDPAVIKDLQELDAALAPLAQDVRASGGRLIVAGDYGMSAVTRAVMPNIALRQAGLLVTRPDAAGKLLVDYACSGAFALVDHQVAHIYCRPDRAEKTRETLSGLAGVDALWTTHQQKHAHGLDHARSGDFIAVAATDSWFAHDWWLSDDEKPAWQFSVDIHRKPGYDPRELFFDPVKKCIAQDGALVRGSHGRVSSDSSEWPVLLCDRDMQRADKVKATDVARWLAGMK